MSATTFRFRTMAANAPNPQFDDPQITYLGAILLGGVVWLIIYGILLGRLWLGASLFDPLNLSLIAVSIPLGVAVVVFCWHVRRSWRTDGQGEWPALTVEELQQISPAAFEEYVTHRIFARQGYRAFNTPDVKDGGVDVLLTDAQGRRAVVQCKRYRNVVGEETLRDLYGTMIHNGAVFAYLVTTGRISKAAQQWADGKPIELIDGLKLEELGK